MNEQEHGNLGSVNTLPFSGWREQGLSLSFLVLFFSPFRVNRSKLVAFRWCKALSSHLFQVCEDTPPHHPSGSHWVYGWDCHPNGCEAQPPIPVSLRSKAGHGGFVWPMHSIPVLLSGAKEVGWSLERHPDPDRAYHQAPEDSDY